MSEVFISHAEEDASIALGVALALEKVGYRTWTYEVDSVPGPSYLVQTGDAVERAGVVLLVISPTSLGSHQCTREVVRGLETGKPFLPLLRDVTHVEFQNRQPEWRSAVGAATSIQVPSEGIATIVPRIIAGLEALGISCGDPQPSSRLHQITDVLTHYDNAVPPPRPDTSPVETPTPAPTAQPTPKPVAKSPTKRWPAVLVAIAVLAALGTWWWAKQSREPLGTQVEPSSLLVPTQPSDKIDIEAIKDKMLVLHDLKGHYVAVIPYWDKADTQHYFFYGDANQMAAQRVHGGGRSGTESFNYSMWDPRFQHAGFSFRDDVYRIQCGDQDVIMASVEKSEAEAILASDFTRPIWKHHAYALARDEAGRYFYVDKSRDAETFRLFSGDKGDLKQFEVVKAVVDSSGVVVHTQGSRLVVTTQADEVAEVSWIVGDTKTELSPLALWPNRAFIYAEMGLYPSTLGTACDNL